MIRSVTSKPFFLTFLILSILAFALCQSSQAASDVRLAKGQTLYVPVYSNVFSAPKAVSFNLATILSIRNTDMSNPITINTRTFQVKRIIGTRLEPGGIM